MAKYQYRAFPLNKPDPVTKENVTWRPVVHVILFHHHQQTRPFEVMLDTGADHTVFHADIAKALGIDLYTGAPYGLRGIAAGINMPGYVHRVRMLIAGENIETPVIFAEKFAVAGLLGQIGFFNHFTVTFDWTPDPPCFELHRIQRN